MNAPPRLRIAVIGAGPVGLALALHAAQALPAAQVQVFDARPLDRDVSADPRTLALSLGSVQLLQRIGAWDASAARPIAEVHVSQQEPSLPGWLSAWTGAPEVRIGAAREGVPMLGAVLSYGAIVAPLQRAWLAACQREPARLACRFGVPVASLKSLSADGVRGGPGSAAGRADGVEVDAGIAERFDIAVVAEGGVYTAQPGDAGTASAVRGPVRADYAQTGWVGTVGVQGGRQVAGGGVAYERFTRHGPAALLPLPGGRAALVWCVNRDDDPVRGLDDAQRLTVLNTLFPAEAGVLTELSPMKDFPLGLSAQRSLCDGRTVRIGNAAQMLHPVAGQGLNLGLRDAFELVRGLARVQQGKHEGDVDAALRRLEWQRAPDRWALIAATDFLARSFTWKLPGAGAARGLGLAALQAVGPLKSALTKQMMYGQR